MVKVALIGFGNMGWIILKILCDKQADVVAVFNRKSHVGEDAGKVAGIGNIGLCISPVNKADEIFSSNKPDICLIQTTEKVALLRPHLDLCAKHKVNVLTLAESLYYPWHEFPSESAELDKQFKDAGCTLTAAGYQDGFMGDLILTLAANASNMRGITGKMVCNANDYMGGSSVAAQEEHHKTICGIGLTPEEFEEKVVAPLKVNENDKVIHGLCASAIQRLVDNFGWTISKVSTICRPSIKKQPHNFVWGTVPAGHAIGLTTEYHVKTDQGFFIDFILIFEAMDDGEMDINEWTIHGDPDVKMSTNPAHINVFTNTSYVNRIPDVIRAPPGLITTNMMQPPRYIHSFAK